MLVKQPAGPSADPVPMLAIKEGTSLEPLIKCTGDCVHLTSLQAARQGRWMLGAAHARCPTAKDWSGCGSSVARVCAWCALS